MKIPVRYRLLVAWLIALLKCRQDADKVWIVEPVEAINRQIASAELVRANFWRRNLLDEYVKVKLQQHIINLEQQRNWFASMHIAAVGFIPRG